MAGKPEAVALFPGDVRSAETFVSKSREVAARFTREDRALSASAIRGGGDQAQTRLDAFVDQGGFMITTGQQPGLFGGPLFGLYKALTAVALAERMETVLGRPVLPVFWIASEDNDWDEVRTSSVLDLDNQLQEIALPPRTDDAHPPLHRIPAGREIPDAVERFLSLLPETEFSARWSELVRHAYRPERTLSDAFEEVMTALTRRAGLFFVQAHEPVLKARALPLLLKELRECEAREQALAELGGRISGEGFALQVPILEGATNLFLEAEGGGRERIFREGADLRLRKSGRRLTMAEVETLVEEDPSVLSPNVFLRPVVESLVFPTLCYVAGPGEAAYLPQTAPVFAGHGIEQPLVHPRASLVVVERKVEKVLDKFHLEIEDLALPASELMGRLAREEIPGDVQEALDAIKRSLGQQTEALRKAVSGVDPTLGGPVDSFRNQSFGNLADVERKVVQSLKRANEVTLGQVGKAQENLFPAGRPQERVFNPFYYLMRYNEAFLVGLGEAARDAVLPR